MKSFLKMLLATIIGGLITVLIVFFIAMGGIGIIVSSTDKPVHIKTNSVLQIKLNQAIADRSSKNPFEGFSFPDFKPSRNLGLDDILSNIRKAKSDENIKGIFLDLSVIPSGSATIQEVRNALIDFKKSGKFVISYADSYMQNSYYLASVSDSVFMNPAGDIAFVGLRAQVMFYKNMLEKLGVEPQIIRHGKFKSAVEPFMLDKMSDANREQLSVFIGSVWQNMLANISESRHIPVEDLNRIADHLELRTAQDALRLKMVNRLVYRDEILNMLDTLSGKKKNEKPDLVELTKYDKVPDPSIKFVKNKIAVIYAMGDVIEGEGQEGNIGSDRISAALRKARKDSTVKAIVFRVNSPGGSALASEVIWREVKLASAVKPVITSMGDLAASGGYYISCAADTIVASPNTITGSIGVFGMLVNVQPLLSKKIGITTDIARTNRFSDFGSAFRPLAPEEKEAIQASIESIYSTFVKHVAEGRKMKEATVDSIGQGRIWSGVNALKLGLVDVLGGLDKAIEIAAAKAHLKEYRIVDMPQLEDPYTQLLKSLSDNAESKYLQRTLGDSYVYYQTIQNILHSQGILARMPYAVTIY